MEKHAALESIVSYVHDLRYESLPGEARNRALDIILDTAGCILGGSITAPGAIQAQVITRLAGQGCATAFGVRGFLDPVSAAYLNAALSDVLDYEETFVGFGHPSAVIVPAAVAAAETVGATGRELITAVVAGYEVGLRIGKAIRPTVAGRRNSRSWYAWKAFGAAAAAAKLLNRSMGTMLDAFGYAGAASPRLPWISRWGRPLHWLKSNYGDQARAGVLAALMAEEGLRGPRLLLDGEYGFSRLIGSDRYETAELTRELGARYEILDTHFKLYPTCHWFHTLVEAAESVRSNGRLKPDDIEEIRICSFPESIDWFQDRGPVSLIDAEFSIEYAVAVALAGIPAGRAWYEPDVISDETLLGLARKVRIEPRHVDGDLIEQGIFPAEVTVRTRDGRAYTASETTPIGSPRRPLTRAQIESKFVDLGQTVLGPEVVRDVWRTGQRLETVENIREWTALLVPSRQNAEERISLQR